MPDSIGLSGATVLLALLSGGAQPETPVLFTATVGGNTDLYQRSAGRSVRITDASEPDNWGKWSPDGDWIAFQSQRDGNYEVYVMRSDGTSQSNISHHPKHDGLAVWSPDGKFVAFFSARGFEYPERGPIPGHVYVYDLASSTLRQVTREPLSSTLGPSSWSPDGEHLLIARREGDKGQIAELTVSTGAERVLVEIEGMIGGALYSPDGTRVAFYREFDDHSEVQALDLETNRLSVLLKQDATWFYPYAWSGDGRLLSVTAIDSDSRYQVLELDVEQLAFAPIATENQPREASWKPR